MGHAQARRPAGGSGQDERTAVGRLDGEAEPGRRGHQGVGLTGAAGRVDHEDLGPVDLSGPGAVVHPGQHRAQVTERPIRHLDVGGQAVRPAAT